MLVIVLKKTQPIKGYYDRDESQVNINIKIINGNARKFIVIKED